MALKAKKTKEVVTEEVTKETPVEDTKVDTTLNDSEKEAQKNQEEQKELEGADMQRLKQTTALISDKFNLDNDFVVKNFDDKGKVIKETLEGKDFILTVTVKDSDKHHIGY